MAEHRHKRDADARRLLGAVTSTRTVAAGLATLATMAVVATGVLSAPVGADLMAGDAEGSSVDTLSASVDATDRTVSDRFDRFVVSRSSSRRSMQEKSAQEKAAQEKAREKKNALEKARADAARAATAQAVRKAHTRLWTTAPLNLWTRSGDDAVQVGLLEEGRRVLVTGRSAGEREEVVIKGKSRWVTAGYLDEDKPVAPADPATATGGACTNGTSVSGGVSPSIVKVHAAVCAAFPSISVYGTLRGGGGDHALGKAVDIMVSGELGYQVAEFVRANYADLGVSYVIYSQHIWSVERASEGWRAMSDRGSTTANHYDHVHVSVF